MIEWISLAYNLVKDFLKFRKSEEKLNPEDIIIFRQKWKKEIIDKMKCVNNKVGYGEVVIRDVKRNDSYPEIEENDNISPWFRVSFLGTYHRGIKVGLGIREVIFDEDNKKYRFLNYKKVEEDYINLYIVGFICFENIVSIDWEGDEYYYSPHIYCKFTNRKGEPYEKIILCEKHFLDESVFYKEIIDYDEVVKFTKKFKSKKV